MDVGAFVRLRRLRGKAIVSAGLTALVSACTSTTPAPTAAPASPSCASDSLSSLIAFSADVDGNWDFYEGNSDIYVMDSHGGNARNLTNHPANDYSPEWSPDGTRIAFRTNRDGNHEIYVMNCDGSNPVNLSRNPSEDRSPAWSPDGRRIAFASNRSGPGQYDIHVMNADVSNVVRLAGPGSDEYPTWSPDGSFIAFTSFCASCSSADLWVMRSDGTQSTSSSPDQARRENSSSPASRATGLRMEAGSCTWCEHPNRSCLRISTWSPSRAAGRSS